MGFIVMEPADTPPMSGSNAICVATVLLESGIVAMEEPETRLTLEAPGGLIEITARCSPPTVTSRRTSQDAKYDSHSKLNRVVACLQAEQAGADEAFLTGTFGAQPPVAEVAGKPIGPGAGRGSVLRRLRERYAGLVRRDTA